MAILMLGRQGAIAQTDEEPAPAEQVSTIAFVNVGVIPMDKEEALSGQTLLVEGDRIVALGPRDEIDVPEGARVIDGEGRFLIPGLVDMHVHVDVPFEDGPLYLNAGVTTVLSMGTAAPSLESIIAQRDESHTRAFDGPSLYTVGPRFMGKETVEDADHIVRLNAEMGFDLVKVYHEVDPATYDKLHEVANEVGIKVTGHGQRDLGMGPIYRHGQDLAHVEEYLYGAFNPDSKGYKIASKACVSVWLLTFLSSVVWPLADIWRRVRGRRAASEDRSSGHDEEVVADAAVKIWVRHFVGASFLTFLGFFLIMPAPCMGTLAGNTLVISLTSLTLLMLFLIAFKLMAKVRQAWNEGDGPIIKRIAFASVVLLVWVFIVNATFLAPRMWATSAWGLQRIAKQSKDAQIHVTTTMIVLDSNVRHQDDETFQSIIDRPEMRYLRPDERDRWIKNNRFRRMPPAARPLQGAMWRSWTKLMMKLTRELHEAGVPLMAGSDAGGPPGVFPGVSMHEELDLLVESGVTPYEALKTATMTPAIYLEGEGEGGRVATGYRADLVLLEANPLEAIDNVRTRVGVMKRGRWFDADELEAGLERLAEERE